MSILMKQQCEGQKQIKLCLHLSLFICISFHLSLQSNNSLKLLWQSSFLPFPLPYLPPWNVLNSHMTIAASGFSNLVWWTDKPDFIVALIIITAWGDVTFMLLTCTSFLSIIAIGGIRELCFQEIRGGAGRLHSNVADGVSLFIFVPYISKKCFFYPCTIYIWRPRASKLIPIMVNRA